MLPIRSASRATICTLGIRPSKPPAKYVHAFKTIATSEKKKEFLCIMPYKPDVLELRKKVKMDHYEGIKPLIATGKLLEGGALLAEHPTEGKDEQILGSIVVYTGEGPEEVRQMIGKDIYATSGVWDLEKLQIYPYVPAVRQPLQ